MDTAIWNEHIFYEPKNKETEDLEKGKVTIKLLDKGFYKDALIGYYEFDLTYLYQQKNHAMLHKWVILTNPESETFGEVTGQLKLSITVIGEGDEQIPIEEDPNPEKEDIIQPPSVKPDFYQVHFKFFTGQKIVPCDTNFGKNSTDAFIRLDYKTSKLKTKIVKCYEDAECDWNQEFWVPAQLPLLGGRIVFRVYDHNTGIPDELIGSIHFELRDILPDRNGNPGKLVNRYDWKQIYGAPMDISGKITDKMNENPEIASFWKGRILMRCSCEKTEKPKLKVKQLDEAEIKEARKNLENRIFSARVFVNQLMNTPKENEKYIVEVRIADKEWTSGEPRSSKSKYNRFNEVLLKDSPEF
jgi:hypothetical protein